MTTLAFGDSFIGPFSLIKDENLKIHKFRGATMRGIGKKENENRIKIIETVNKNKDINCMIFSFGQVDLNFSYYYNKFITKKNFMISSIVKNYIDFIKNLNCNNCKKIIIPLYPLTIKDENVFKSLISYDILSSDIVNSIDDLEKKKLSSFSFRYNMYLKFNNLLEKYCNLYKINFIKLDDILLDNNNKLKKKFIIPYSVRNIHLLWEPLVPILLSRILKCGINNKYKKDLTDSYKKFIKEKYKKNK